MIRKLISMLKKAKKFLNPKRVFKKTEEKVEERVYAFTINDENGNPKEVINVKESELTLGQLNFLHQKFIENYLALPLKVKLAFISEMEAGFIEKMNEQNKEPVPKELEKVED